MKEKIVKTCYTKMGKHDRNMKKTCMECEKNMKKHIFENTRILNL
jgi:hypothetical protein